MLVKRQEYIFIPLILLLVALTPANFIPPVAALLVVVFAMALSAYQYFLQRNKPFGFYGCWLAAIVLGVVVGLYRPSGFNYPLVFSVSQLYDGGLPFSLYVNIAKLLAGYLILWFLFSQKAQVDAYVRAPLRQIALAAGLGLLVFVVAYFFLDLQFHLKALNYVVTFAAVNLLVTCVAEEAFMRLLLQAQLQGFVARKTANRYWQEFFPLFITTAIFILTHLTHNLPTMLVFGLAGLGYGVVYSLTKNIWACVLVHFMVNIVHFALLTYPLA